MKKRILTLTMAILLVLSTMLAFSACEQQDDGKYVVGICQLMPHPALDAATQGFMDALKQELGEENVTFLNMLGVWDYLEKFDKK